MNDVAARVEALQTGDGHRFELIARIPASPRRALLWLPAMGVPAKHYLPFADALAARGVAVFLHEWRGIGSSSLRAGRDRDWGYRQLLCEDIAASQAAMRVQCRDLSRIIGGHSLGGQLACCRLALDPDAADALWLVASGAPYWRAFPPPQRWLLPPLYRFLDWLAQARGVLPGRRLRFAGNEARGVIRDWSRSGLSGRYRAAGVDADLELGMSRVEVPVRAAWLDGDWLGPESSLRFLLGKLASTRVDVVRITPAVLGAAADHFTWMRHPGAIADWLLSHPGPAD
ncbi:alpha/beta hydrolase [Luteimonas sp. BDR2-5]|uniref:alpha/beta hydrolase family protein n=1 Tax=Proluteimonas luteida TaxID=2878685 RepID=UPI001E3F54F7|nr:alpha/beta fold hydrolase [Luteimonas sp. BDR2-5]MCD9028387.1 alpha/beta hydrolase [Luteimonas sp. BDR2-5]